LRGREKVNEDVTLRAEQSRKHAWMFPFCETEGVWGSAISRRGFPSVHRRAVKKLISCAVY